MGIETSLTGIVLAGGLSTRMRMDKGILDYHGMPQRGYVYKMLQEVCTEVFYSCRPDQMRGFDDFTAKLIPDKYPEKGPLGALLSVFSHDPVTAKLVVAVDLPYLDKNTLEFLIESRNPNKVATAFRNSFDQKPEPLLAIWEPRSYQLLMEALAADRLSPRDLMMSCDVFLIDPPNKQALQSVDSLEDSQEALRYFKKKS